MFVCLFFIKTINRINSETFKHLIDIGSTKSGVNSAEFDHTLGSNFHSINFNGVTIKWDQKGFRIYVTLDSKWIGKVCFKISFRFSGIWGVSVDKSGTRVCNMEAQIVAEMERVR